MPSLADSFVSGLSAFGGGGGAGAAGGGLSGALGVGTAGGLAATGIGLAVAALPVAMDLLSCGTVTQLGCQKRTASDLTQTIVYGLAVPMVAYERGQISLAQAQASQAQLLAKASSLAVPNFSMTELITGAWEAWKPYNGAGPFCPANAKLDAKGVQPIAALAGQNSQTYRLLCTGIGPQIQTLQDLTDYMQESLLQIVPGGGGGAAAVPSMVGGASVAAAAAARPVVSAVAHGGVSWVWIAAAVVVIAVVAMVVRR